jgi:hypothetical protein
MEITTLGVGAMSAVYAGLMAYDLRRARSLGAQYLAGTGRCGQRVRSTSPLNESSLRVEGASSDRWVKGTSP